MTIKPIDHDGSITRTIYNVRAVESNRVAFVLLMETSDTPQLASFKTTARLMVEA